MRQLPERKVDADQVYIRCGTCTRAGIKQGDGFVKRAEARIEGSRKRGLGALEAILEGFFTCYMPNAVLLLKQDGYVA